MLLGVGGTQGVAMAKTDRAVTRHWVGVRTRPQHDRFNRSNAQQLVWVQGRLIATIAVE